TDGGATWTAAATGSSRHLFALAFPTRERGHGVGDFGTMVHTEDAGREWAVAHVPPEVELPESALDAGVDPGDVNLYALSYGDPGTVLTRAHGGSTWTVEPLPIELAARWIRSIWLAPGGHGLAVGADGLVFTIDGGGLHRLGAGAPEARS